MSRRPFRLDRSVATGRLSYTGVPSDRGDGTPKPRARPIHSPERGLYEPMRRTLILVPTEMERRRLQPVLEPVLVAILAPALLLGGRPALCGFVPAQSLGWQQWPGDTGAPDQIGDLLPAAAAEDMEGFAVAMACRLRGVPLDIVRGISNAAGDRDRSHWQVSAALEAAGRLALQIMAEAL